MRLITYPAEQTLNILNSNIKFTYRVKTLKHPIKTDISIV